MSAPVVWAHVRFRIAQLESLVSKLSEANTRLTLRLGSAQLERLDDKPAPERASREPVDSAGAAAEREALGEFVSFVWCPSRNPRHEPVCGRRKPWQRRGRTRKGL